MEQYPFAEVAVLVPLYNTFTYSVPDRFQTAAAPGMRVLVPFGRRRVTGYILKLQKSTPDFKTKGICDILDDRPLFPESMIDLFKWTSNYYIHPLGDVIKTALPAGLNQYDVTMVSPLEKGLELLTQGRLTPGESEVMERLADTREVPLKQLSKAVRNPGIHSLAAKMERKGLILRSSTLRRDRARLKREKFLSLTDGPEESIRMSKKRLQILDTLKPHAEMSLSGLKKQIPSAGRLVKPLEAAGYIRIVEREVFEDPLGDPVDPDIPPDLTEEQEAIVSRLTADMDKGFERYLLFGVTGSGKTEVYMRIVQQALEKGKAGLILVPEISLISQTERRFRARFGENVAVLHSGLTGTEFLDQWRKILEKEAKVVIGARSSIFAPVPDPGVIIVDEEHDTSYKQETGLRYNARDLAVVRARMNRIPVLLGSATPSIQSYHNTRTGKFVKLSLEKRINKKPLPEITLVDLKDNHGAAGIDRIISPTLSKAVRKCLDNGEQALIFLNRRGFSTFPLCGSCGSSLKCRYCDVTMTFHKEQDEYRCHICGFASTHKISCPECGSKGIKPLGFGTEKIENMLSTLFPDARIARMDQDTTSGKGQMVKLLKRIKNHTVDIVVGTQMLAKGHDFPNITLVGIVCADLSLNFPDFRSCERTFQLLAQVAGRAGRGDKKGSVVMQTYNRDHFSITSSKKQDFTEFYLTEIPFRKALLYPPYARIIQLKISGKDKKKVEATAKAAGEYLGSKIRNDTDIRDAVQILGPVEAGIPKIASRFRWQILLKAPSAHQLNRLVRELIEDKEIQKNKGVSIAVDVDPYHML